MIATEPEVPSPPANGPKLLAKPGLSPGLVHQLFRMPEASDMKRAGILVSGEDRVPFLQNLVTNNIERLSDGPIYSALLTPQGKFLIDFFLLQREDGILIDVKPECAGDLFRRLVLYRLRSKVEVREVPIRVERGIENKPTGAFDDPRHPALGWRFYDNTERCPGISPDWNFIRVRNCIPETLIELVPNQTYILEAGFERLNGVDFHKGCYVGQEVTARMRHKSQLRKRLATVRISGETRAGKEIIQNDRIVGVVLSQSRGLAIAYLRFDRLGAGPMQSGSASIEMIGN